jgi:hypothetical protein
MYSNYDRDRFCEGAGGVPQTNPPWKSADIPCRLNKSGNLVVYNAFPRKIYTPDLRDIYRVHKP